METKINCKIPSFNGIPCIIIPANALIVSGGSILAGQKIDDIDHNKVTTSRALRTTGQVIFLLQTGIAIGFAVYVYNVEGLRHSNIYSIFLVSPFILVRGIFGILSIYVNDMNYYDISNYTAEGFHTKFVVYEYVLATTMEFITGCIYISNYFFDTRTTKKFQSDEEDTKLIVLNDNKKVWMEEWFSYPIVLYS